MASQPDYKNKNKYTVYSPLKLLVTIVKESFKNIGETTHITISKNGNGERVIRTELSKTKDKSESAR